MQPPLLPPANQSGTAHLKAVGEVTPERADLDPGPAGAGPHFEQDTRFRAILPLACVERDGLVPGTRRDWWVLSERLLLFAGFLGLCLFFAETPSLEGGGKGAGRSKSGIDGSSPKHRRDILRNRDERQDGRSILHCGMSELLQRREGLFVFESQDAFMRLNDLKVEGYDTVEQRLMSCKTVGLLRLIVQALSDRRRGLCHARPPSALGDTPGCHLHSLIRQ